MRLEGELDLPLGVNEAKEYLGDPRRIVHCLPYLTSWEELDERTINALFRVRIDAIGIEYLARLTCRATIRLESKSAGEISYSFDGRVAGFPYSGRLLLRLRPRERASTRVVWRADLELGSLLDLIGGFVDLKSLVDGIVEDIVEGITACVRAPKGD